MFRTVVFVFVTFVLAGVMLFVGLVGFLELLEILQIIDENPAI